jgi:hypothetical protein
MIRTSAFLLAATLCVFFALPAAAQRLAQDEPRQWEIRGQHGVNVDREFIIINLRRQDLDLSSRLAFFEMPSGFRDTTGFGNDGGLWVFKREQQRNVRDHRSIREEEFLAIYNTKTRRYLEMGGDQGGWPVWSDRPRYVWMLKGIKLTGEGRSRATRFAIFSVEQRNFLGLCTTAIDHVGPAYNNLRLCGHAEPAGWRQR